MKGPDVQSIKKKKLFTFTNLVSNCLKETAFFARLKFFTWTQKWELKYSQSTS